MFVHIQLEKNCIKNLYLYFNKLLINEQILINNIFLFEIYLKLKSAFFVKYKYFFELKDFFTLIALEEKNFNNFNLHKYSVKQFYNIIKIRLNKLIEFHFIPFYNLFDNLLTFIIEQPSSDMELIRNTLTKSEKYKKDKFILLKLKSELLLFIQHNFFDINIFNDSCDLLINSLFRKKMYKTFFNFEKNKLYFDIVNFILIFKNDIINISTGLLPDFVHAKKIYLTNYNYNYNQIFNTVCYKFFNLLPYNELSLFKYNFWTDLIHFSLKIKEKKYVSLIKFKKIKFPLFIKKVNKNYNFLNIKKNKIIFKLDTNMYIKKKENSLKKKLFLTVFHKNNELINIDNNLYSYKYLLSNTYFLESKFGTNFPNKFIYDLKMYNSLTDLDYNITNTDNPFGFCKWKIFDINDIEMSKHKIQNEIITLENSDLIE